MHKLLNIFLSLVFIKKFPLIIKMIFKHLMVFNYIKSKLLRLFWIYVMVNIISIENKYIFQ